MKINKPDLPNQGSEEAAEHCSTKTDPPSDLNVQQRVAFAADLFQSDVTLRTLLESLAEGVVVIDSTATIIFVNRQAERLFGYTKQEIVGQPLNLLLPAKFHSCHPKHVAGYFAKPKIRPMGLEQELAARHKSGHSFPVEISLSHLETTSGSLAMAFITDITLRRDAINNLESRNEELDAFAHTVAHDLKGSLATLIGYTELLNDHEVNLSEEQIQASLDIVNRMSRKMADVVDGLLLLSSVRREDVIADPLDMTSIINEAMFRLSEKIKESGAEITTAKDFPMALGYAPWLEEVWYNYISNAVKYGGTHPKITLGGELVEDGFARFWVKDNGPGLCHSELAQLFVPSSSRTKHSDGNGLGLSIVKRIVGKLHGSVGVESEMNEGSLFSFTLPVMK
ncbi:MAG: sensor histidine kinase [Desulfuromonadales bacterium]